MQLFLLRHADADTAAARDDERRLSAKGVEQAERVGRFCKSFGIAPARLLTSPVVRARETAEIFASKLGELSPELAPFLACGMQPATAIKELKQYAKDESVMIVGHEPDFSLLVANLIRVPDHAHLRVRKASLTLLEVFEWHSGGARLEFSIPCRYMT